MPRRRVVARCWPIQLRSGTVRLSPPSHNHSLRDEMWRHTRSADGGEELCNHEDKADSYEWINLAGGPQHAQVKAALAKWLPNTNREQLPRHNAAQANRAK